MQRQIFHSRKISVRRVAAACLMLDFFSLACLNLMRYTFLVTLHRSCSASEQERGHGITTKERAIALGSIAHWSCRLLCVIWGDATGRAFSCLAFLSVCPGAGRAGSSGAGHGVSPVGTPIGRGGPGSICDSSAGDGAAAGPLPGGCSRYALSSGLMTFGNGYSIVVDIGYGLALLWVPLAMYAVLCLRARVTSAPSLGMRKNR